MGLVPAVITIWIRRSVEEPVAWRKARGSVEARAGTGFAELFRGRLLPLTAALTLMNACCLFAWWGFNLWVPAYLSLPSARGGMGLAPHTMTAIVVFMQVGMWLGYVTFGVVSDRYGRKRTYVVYLLAAAILMAVFGVLRTPAALFLLSPLVAFAATGYFTGFATVTAEIYETRIRATAQGFCYNTGRVASAAAPFAVGSVADTHGFGMAFGISAVAFLLAACLWVFIPETLRAAAAVRRTGE